MCTRGAVWTLSAALMILLPAGPAGQTSQASSIGMDHVVSPTVAASWIVHFDDANTPHLDLLVLWRGSPGWFMQNGSGAGGSNGSSGGSGSSGSGVVNLTVHSGAIYLGLTFDSRSRQVEIGGQTISLGDTNVILIDGVDTEPRVAGTLHVERTTLRDDGQVDIDSLLRSSGELIEYLQCGARVPDPGQQEMADFLCARLTGDCSRRFANPMLQKMLDASCAR